MLMEFMIRFNFSIFLTKILFYFIIFDLRIIFDIRLSPQKKILAIVKKGDSIGVTIAIYRSITIGDIMDITAILVNTGLPIVTTKQDLAQHI